MICCAKRRPRRIPYGRGRCHSDYRVCQCRRNAQRRSSRSARKLGDIELHIVAAIFWRFLDAEEPMFAPLCVKLYRSNWKPRVPIAVSLIAWNATRAACPSRGRRLPDWPPARDAGRVFRRQSSTALGTPRPPAESQLVPDRLDCGLGGPKNAARGVGCRAIPNRSDARNRSTRRRSRRSPGSPAVGQPWCQSPKIALSELH